MTTNVLRQIFALAIAFLALTGMNTAEAKCNTDCGRVHTWGASKRVYLTVSYCFVPNVGAKGNRTRVACSDPRARHGKLVCFVAGGYEYHDLANVVYEGRRFFNRKKPGGGGEPDWQ